MKLNEIVKKPATDFSDFDIETPFDWFYDHMLRYADHPAGLNVSNNYLDWKAKNKNNIHPLLFITMAEHHMFKTVRQTDIDEIIGDIHERVTFNADNTVDYDGTLNFSNLGENLETAKPPFKFNKVTSFMFRHNNITEYEEWMPSHITKMLELSYNRFTSLAGLDKNLKSVGDLRMFSNPIKSSVMSLFKIKIARSFQVELKDSHAEDIINGYIKQVIEDPTSAKKMMRSCQSELVDNGFEEYAKL